MGCSLLPGKFGILVQGILFAVSIGVLVLKKKREDVRLGFLARSWPTFLLDSSKQLLGAGWIHVANLLCAVLLGDRFKGDGCEWYWVNIMLDTTLGVGIEYLILQALTNLLEWASGYQGIFLTGEYRDFQGNLVVSKYLAQLVVWLVCVTGMKFVIVILMIVFHTPLLLISQFFLGLFSSNPRLELIVVMIITPCCMNALQFWLTDNFIKRHDHGGGISLQAGGFSLQAGPIRLPAGPQETPLPVPACGTCHAWLPPALRRLPWQSK